MRSLQVGIAAQLIAGLGGAYLIFLSMSLGRPIWLDEFLQFAVAAEPSSGEAWALIRRSARGINHNQTGAYLMADYWLERAGGASATLLRLPSILSGCFFVLSTIALFRRLNLSAAWTLLAFLALLGQSMTMYFVGEARPYFPLVAATAGTLLFYMTPLSARTGAIRAIGWVSVTLGALFHPYFAFYWVMIAVVTYVHGLIDSTIVASVRSLARHLDVTLCAFGSTIYFALAFGVWLSGPKDFGYDPFEMTPDPLETFLHVHFEFLSPYGVYTAVVTAAAIGIAALCPTDRRGSLKGLILPLLLIIAMIAVSIFVSWASYNKNYWIIYRQWVASAGLMPILIVWVWAETARVYNRISGWIGPSIFILAVAASLSQAGVVHNMRWAELAKFRTDASKEIGACDPAKLGTPSDGKNESFVLWVALANKNIRCGGKVWPNFGRYYSYSAPKLGGDN